MSNPRATVALYAMDVDPCTGETTDRIIATLGLRGGRNEQNKFEYRNDILSGYTREYRVVAEINGVPKTRVTKNGLTMGEYVQPVNVWVHAEQNVPGTPPVPFDFSQMEFLTRGVGRDADGNLWGPLQPFPQTGVFIEPPVCEEPTVGTAGAEDGAADDEADDETEPVVEKRGTGGGWYTRARAEAVGDAENKGTSEPALMRVAPQPKRVDMSRPGRGKA